MGSCADRLAGDIGDAAASTDRHDAHEAPSRARLRAVLVADKLFERHPGTGVAYIENGGTWVVDLLHGLEVLRARPGHVPDDPADQFVGHLGRPLRGGQRAGPRHHLPGRAVLFGSDWPHAKASAIPRDFFKNVEELPIEDQRRIMVENHRELTIA